MEDEEDEELGRWGGGELLSLGGDSGGESDEGGVDEEEGGDEEFSSSAPSNFISRFEFEVPRDSVPSPTFSCFPFIHRGYCKNDEGLANLLTALAVSARVCAMCTVGLARVPVSLTMDQVPPASRFIPAFESPDKTGRNGRKMSDSEGGYERLIIRHLRWELNS